MTDTKAAVPASLMADIWHDPVWSAVIAGLIVLAVAGIAGGIWRGRLWKGTGFVTLIVLCCVTLWHFGGALGRWIAAPAQVSHGALLALLVVLFASGWVLARRRYGPVEPAPAASEPPAPPRRAAPEDFRLSNIQHAAASVMLECYPDRLDLETLQVRIVRPTPLDQALGNPLPLNRGLLAREMEGLERVGIVWIDRLGRTVSYYHLTDDGRNWLLDNIGRGWDHRAD